MKKAFGMQSKFLRVLFISTMVLLLSIFIILNLMLLGNEKNKYSMNAESRMDALSKLIDGDYNSALDISNNVVNSQIVTDILKTSKTNMEEIITSYALLGKFFKGFAEYEKNAANQFWIYPEDPSFPEGAHVSKIDKLMQREIWTRLSAAQDNESVWSATDGAEPYISLYRRITNYGTPLGYLEIKMPLRHVLNTIKDVQLLEGEQIAYQTAAGGAIYQSGEKKPTENGYHYVRELVNGDRILLCAEKKHVLGSYYFYTLVFIIMFIIVMFAIYFVYKYIVSNVTKDLQDFIHLLEYEDKDLASVDFSRSGSDKDIMRIKKKFQNLILKINRMHDDIEKINTEKKKVELEFLQMSFNPHLLYNSLSSIKWRLYNSGEEQMSELIEHMTAYYRAVLSEGENVITIREEIGLIRQYLTIIEMSYNSKIRLIVEMDESLSECYIIKQLLQPVVENAVMHGINGIEDAQIKICVAKESGDIIFSVANNGCAISEEAIRRALSGEGGIPSKRGYGIKNTINRIKTYYGNEYGLDIIGRPGVGTEVVIRIEYLDEETLKLRM